jgi:hypothetical protein
MHQLKEKAIHNFLTIPGIHLAQLSTDVCLLFVQKRRKNVSFTLIAFNILVSIKFHHLISATRIQKKKNFEVSKSIQKQQNKKALVLFLNK